MREGEEGGNEVRIITQFPLQFIWRGERGGLARHTASQHTWHRTYAVGVGGVIEENDRAESVREQISEGLGTFL